MNKASGHSIVVTTTVELVGVALMAVLAGISDNVGKVMVMLMTGFLILWLITNTPELIKIVGKTQ